MIGNHTISRVDAIVVFLAKFALIASHTSQLLYPGKDREEDVGVVIRPFVLNHGYKSFESHAGVDMFERQRLETSVVFSVELNENVVPNF